MKKHKTLTNYRWWIMVITLSPLYLTFFILWFVSGVFEILANLTSAPLNSRTPKWMVKVFNWVKRG